MALDGVLANIPGLRGYLAQQDFDQRQALGGLQGAMGVLQAVRQHEEAQRQAAMAPLQQRLIEAQAGQAEGLAQERAQSAAFNQALPGLVAQAQGPDGQIDFGRLSGALMQTPGGLKPGMDLRRTEEDRAARVQRDQALLEQRSQQATQLHETRLAQAQTAAERAAETARHNRFMEGLSGQLAAIRAENSQGGGNRREPFKFAINGQNVQGWRDRVGNVYGPDGKAVSGYQPEISSADQSAEQKRVGEQETVSTVNDMLGRIERIAASNPRTVAGIGAQVSNAVNWMANQVGGNISGQYTRGANEQAVQIRDSMISALGGLGRLSNQDRQRIEDTWKLGVSGNAQAVQDAIQLTRQIVNSKYSGSAAPVARGQPGGNIPPPPPGFKVD